MLQSIVHEFVKELSPQSSYFGCKCPPVTFNGEKKNMSQIAKYDWISGEVLSGGKIESTLMPGIEPNWKRSLLLNTCHIYNRDWHRINTDSPIIQKGVWELILVDFDQLKQYHTN